MAQTIPITLLGENLGERHRHLNSWVNQAAATVNSQTFRDFEDLHELTPVDRLFKIDIANKLRNVEYILKTLKDDDMLYVSKALKCKWLVDRTDIINPKYLEDSLFPNMIMPAISKMKHWLYITLTDPQMCKEFYFYYKNVNFDFAAKFLRRCDNAFLLEEFPTILTRITPHYLKVLGEKCPKLVKVYFESFDTNNDLVKTYLEKEQIFYNSIKCILKLEPEIFLDITEKYHSTTSFNKISPTGTEYIVRYHKDRFMAKVELYVAHILHLPTVAQVLSVEECQDVVIKLARAGYLNWWFSYANVEPLVKRVGRKDRAAFKKRVFVEKKVGERVAEWPYPTPKSPVLSDTTSGEPHVFDDQEYEPIRMLPKYEFKSMLKKRKCMAYKASDCLIMSECPVKSELQKLFDEFRFVGFEGTLHELKGRISAACSADRRRDMLLVLVSKSGGRADSVQVLLQLAMRLRNEPVHERAAIVRSLVKRASAWRLPQHVWDTMLEYGQGLGLDGSKAEAECREGLHAVVMRHILTTGECDPAVRAAFIDNFSTLVEYKLTASERASIALGLQRILMTAAADAEPEAAARHLEQLLDVLTTYHMSFKSATSAVAALAERDPEAAKLLLGRLYDARVGRRELLRQYLAIRHDDAALVNALRHDPEALKTEWLVKLLTDGETRADQFFLKLALYFNETGGMAERVRQALLDMVNQEPHVKLARPLATLAGTSIESIWTELDKSGGENYKVAAALRSNMHRARPCPDALAIGWRKTGVKALACQVLRCRPAQVQQLGDTLLNERAKRTVRLALVLAQRTDCVADVFEKVATIKPVAALRAALPYYRRFGESADVRVWEIVKPIISTVNLKDSEGLRKILGKVKWLPKAIKPEYCAILYLVFEKMSDRHTDWILADLMTCLPEVREDLLEEVLLRMLESIDKEHAESYPAIFIRYLMLSKNNKEQQSRFAKIGKPFLEKVYAHRDGKDELSRNFFKENLQQIMSALQYNHVFFDVKYECCLSVIEIFLTWIQEFLPKDIHFEYYVKIHATMLYFKAIRQSVKQRPKVFQDHVKKMTLGVEIVGFTFGRYIIREVEELKSRYFDSVIEIYSKGFSEYLSEYFLYGIVKAKFVAAVIKGMLSAGEANEARLAIHVLSDSRYEIENDAFEEIKELAMQNENKEIQFFAYALIYS